MNGPTRSPLTILVASREKSAGDALIPLLHAQGWVADWVGDSRSLYLAFLQRPPHILVIDDDLPAEGGMAVIRHLRSIRNTAGIGILMLAGEDAPERLAGLQAGADAVLRQPLEQEEVMAYITALDRRVRPEVNAESSLCWQYHQHEWKLVSPSGAGIGLSHLEAAFVHMIARQPGQPVRRRDIIAHAFGQDPLHYDQRRLEALVSRLRKKVHRSYPLSQPIRVVHSIGYVFTDSIRCFDLPSS